MALALINHNIIARINPSRHAAALTASPLSLYRCVRPKSLHSLRHAACSENEAYSEGNSTIFCGYSPEYLGAESARTPSALAREIFYRGSFTRGLALRFRSLQLCFLEHL